VGLVSPGQPENMMSLLTVSTLIFTSVGGPPDLMPVGPRRRSSGTGRTQPEREVRDRGHTVMVPTRHCGSFHSRSGVEQNKVFAVDVTQLNFNETCEVGYALVSYQINLAFVRGLQLQSEQN
jgi:hypothetical protein